MERKAGNDAATGYPHQDQADEQPPKARRHNRAKDGNSGDDGDRYVHDVAIQRWKDEGGAWIRPD